MGVGIIFPGQGSQYVGMGKDFYEEYSTAKKVYDDSSLALGYSLSDITFQGTEDTLKLTYNAQPAILATSIAVYNIIKNKLPEISGYAGHSLGEYTAVVASGGMELSDAVKAVHNRGKFMQDAVPVGTGGMLAVMGGKREDILRMCKNIASECGCVLEPANFNSPAQTVLAGHVTGINRALDKHKDYGIKRAVSIPVSAPFHCSLMEPAAEKMRDYLAGVDMSDTDVPVYSNVNAEKATESGIIRNNFIKQVASPVMWEDLVLKMFKNGIESFIEVGPGNVLSGLMKKIDKRIKCINISEIQDIVRLEGFDV